MANNRKTSKGASSGRPRSYSELYRNSREGAPKPPSVNNGQPAASATPVNRTEIGPDASDWRADYGYVMDDLRRLSIISGVLIAVMIVASFFI